MNFETAPIQTILLIIGIVVLTVGVTAIRIRSKIKTAQELSHSIKKPKKSQQK